MCCRFYTDKSTKEDIREIADSFDPHIDWHRQGDVHPGEASCVIVADQGGLFARDMIFGMPPWLSAESGLPAKSLVINARAETVRDRKMFADSIAARRCVIPAKHFYEWDREKNKAVFSSPGEPSVYLAGIFGGGGEFVILTTAANGSMRPVHDRMPLILARSQILPWLKDPAQTKQILKQVPAELASFREYEQLRLF